MKLYFVTIHTNLYWQLLLLQVALTDIKHYLGLDANIITVSSDDFNFLAILLVSFIAGPVFGFISILYMRSLLFFAKLAENIKGNVVFKYAF